MQHFLKYTFFALLLCGINTLKSMDRCPSTKEYDAACALLKLRNQCETIDEKKENPHNPATQSHRRQGS
jgi:hypothetical protein